MQLNFTKRKQIKKKNRRNKMKIGIINVNLQYEFPDDYTDKEIENFLANVDLPDEYVEDSFDFVKIVNE